MATVTWLAPAYGGSLHAMRACELCIHSEASADPATGLLCTHAKVAGPASSKPAMAARGLHGGCGPDAVHMHHPAWGRTAGQP